MIELPGDVRLAIRPMRHDDEAYVYGTWIQSCRFRRLLDKETYFAEQRRMIGEELANPNTRAFVACSPELDSAIHGWAVGNAQGFLHYAYVPPPLRKLGIFKALVTQVLGEYGDRIPVTHELPFPSRRFVFNFYLLRRCA